MLRQSAVTTTTRQLR